MRTIILPNGICVYYIENHKLNSDKISVSFLLDTKGLMTNSTIGYNHLLEHLLYDYLMQIVDKNGDLPKYLYSKVYDILFNTFSEFIQIQYYCDKSIFVKVSEKYRELFKDFSADKRSFTRTIPQFLLEEYQYLDNPYEKLIGLKSMLFNCINEFYDRISQTITNVQLLNPEKLNHFYTLVFKANRIKILVVGNNIEDKYFKIISNLFGEIDLPDSKMITQSKLFINKTRISLHNTLSFVQKENSLHLAHIIEAFVFKAETSLNKYVFLTLFSRLLYYKLYDSFINKEKFLYSLSENKIPMFYKGIYLLQFYTSILPSDIDVFRRKISIFIQKFRFNKDEFDTRKSSLLHYRNQFSNSYLSSVWEALYTYGFLGLPVAYEKINKIICEMTYETFIKSSENILKDIKNCEVIVSP